jgi:protein-tyrosine phosphatase
MLATTQSSTLVLAYLMKKHNWSFKDAITFVRKSRPVVCPNLGFERQLKEYEVQLKQQHQR